MYSSPMVMRVTWSRGSYLRICWYSAMAGGTLPWFSSFCAASTYLLLLLAMQPVRTGSRREVRPRRSPQIAAKQPSSAAERKGRVAALLQYASRAKREVNEGRDGCPQRVIPVANRKLEGENMANRDVRAWPFAWKMNASSGLWPKRQPGRP